jgi:hypothetical protein
MLLVFFFCVTADCYLLVPQRRISSVFQKSSVSFEETFLQQDMVLPLNLSAMLDVCDERFDDSVLFNDFPG